MSEKQNWVDSLVQECSHVETPEAWLWWSFLAAISATAGNNYYFTTLKGDLIYKPNLYVILLGESGLGKGFPVSRARSLVDKTHATRVIAGRSSIQGIIKELSMAKTSPNGGPPIMDSRGFVVNGELGSAFISDPQALHIMTDLYDGQFHPEKWTNLLKGDGAEVLKKPYLTALFGANPTVFYASVPDDNITGGYVGRNLIVYEEKRARDVDLMDEDDEVSKDDRFETYIYPKYVPHLEKIAANEGRLIADKNAKELYNTWRRKWRQSQGFDKTGFMNRVPDHVIKVSMCLALAEWDFTGEIRQYHMEDSIQRVTGLIYANKKTTEGRGPDPTAAATKLVIDFLLAADNQQLTRKRLLQKGYGTFNSLLLDQIIDNLMEMGWVKRRKEGAGSAMDWLIMLSGEPLEGYKKFLREKEKK